MTTPIEDRTVVRLHRKSDMRATKDALASGDPVVVRMSTPLVGRRVVKQSDDTAGPTIEIIASTDQVDREGDTIDQNGWRLENYRANPVVPWVHDYSQPPVARALETEVDDEGRLVQQWEFTPRDLYPFGHMVGRMYELGFLNAASVGFDPEEWKFIDERGGLHFEEQELLESSGVVVPANPGALELARDAGIDTEPMREWTERMLDQKDWGDPMQRQIAESVWKHSSGSVSKESGVSTFTVKFDSSEIVEKIESRIDEVEQKEGRVLSQENLQCLVRARDEINTVIKQALDEDDEERTATIDKTENTDMLKTEQISALIRAIEQKQLDADALQQVADRIGDFRQEAAAIQGAIGAVVTDADDPDPELVEALDEIASSMGEAEQIASEQAGLIGGVISELEGGDDDEDDGDDPEQSSEEKPDHVDDEDKSAAFFRMTG